jgi:hypothetical protein
VLVVVLGVGGRENNKKGYFFKERARGGRWDFCGKAKAK